MDVRWTCVPQDMDHWTTLADIAMNQLVPEKAENVCTSGATISFLRSTLLHGVGSAS